ncbi:hypothetical protein FOB58_001808 [Candida parapsilosis]|uniref:Uncharacterized protein n=2 Tax=Candida parapsilosis TaxID=5480 RepID=G8BCI4_CANPC|nr:uncharacterized protein CPAR2_804000 [Candida parapsilosis]KAF6051748.1 hypothetical protein FOB58_001808 [Candida parapsilosis]KAF6052755.1 hypothetical protein FOB60_003011 [Candida parapsilosis]KAF6053550.1 hypothetical protein FOB59_001832 [Candida parapsilosis]KAF6064532.1 hypothetical protein FOB61_002958 [Candida parapsilosis]CCE41850.1 hypothetical protein CPAR2_804000 [Candida parapsilosis]
MNMKFMQKAESTQVSDNREEQRRKIDDVSEWSLPSSSKILKLAQRKPKIEVLGYGSIMSDRNYTSRKSWIAATNKTDLNNDERYEPSRSRHKDVPNVGELDTLWRKRKPEGSPDRRNKRRAT